MMYLISISVLRKGLTMLNATKSKEGAGACSRNFYCYWLDRQLRVHKVHVATKLWTSLAMSGQLECYSMVLDIRHLPEYPTSKGL